MAAALRFRFGDIELDAATREVLADGEPVAIEPMVFDVLLYLVHHRDRVVPKEELLDELWGDRFVSESTLSSRIKSVRRAVGDDGRSQHVIRTVHGVGYRFTAPVTVLDRDAADPEPGTDTGVDVDPHPSGSPFSGPSVEPPVELDLRFVDVGSGLRVAAGATGQGPPLVKTATWMTQVDRDTTDNPIWSHWVRALSRRHRYVRYDARGCGLSDRELGDTDLSDLSLWVDDLEAVIDRFELDRVALLGVSQGGPVAIAFAVRHPERVSHLVLFGTYARGMRRRGDERQADQASLQVELARVAWDSSTPTFREVFARQFVPEAHTTEIAWLNAQLQVTTDSVNAPRLEGAFHDLDVSELATRVTTPTLVLHTRGDEAVPFEEGRRVAGLIPGARFVPLEGRNHALLERDDAFDRLIAEIDAFTTPR